MTGEPSGVALAERLPRGGHKRSRRRRVGVSLGPRRELPHDSEKHRGQIAGLDAESLPEHETRCLWQSALDTPSTFAPTLSPLPCCGHFSKVSPMMEAWAPGLDAWDMDGQSRTARAIS